MAELALGLWVVQVLGGAYLWTFTLGVGRPGEVGRVSDLPSLVLFVHPLTGLTGLGTWIAYLEADHAALAWTSLALLVLGALLGDVLLARTLRGPRRRGGLVRGARAEDLMPKPVVAMHGLMAVVLLALVLVEALRA